MAGLLEKDQSLKREDLADLIAIADVRATPFLARVNKSRKPTNTLFQWGVDAYAAVDVSAVVDGKDVAEFENHASSRAKLRNHVQVKRRTAKVSRLAQDVSDVAGVSDEIANATAKKLKELGRDIEATCLGDSDAQADDGSVGYKTCALDVWISTAGPTLYGVPAAYRPASAQIVTTATASLSEDTDVQGILTAIFDATGMQGDYWLLCGSVLRRRFTDMTRTSVNSGSTNSANRVRTFNLQASAKTIPNSTTVYEGDFGSITVEASSFIGDTGSGPDTDRGYLLDMDKVHLRYHKMPAVERLLDQGGGPRIMCEAVFGLQVDNPKGMGKFKP